MRDLYPECFYSTESCPHPCNREEYARCPVNLDFRNSEEYRKILERSKQENITKTHDITSRKQRKKKEKKTFNDISIIDKTGGLICPNCGDTDRGNRMGKTPWCIKCNTPLTKRELAKNWIKPKPKFKSSLGYNEPEVVLHG